ncbi:Major surface-labeled trophozoite antigen precursor [Giardia duodenalis]|uniref:Major surface-labeled trophozoite antigen n=1 Tax=Giardia intestinalis TaxID=5741 RepID=V6TNM8_GIAIN|nr:Major surface-labeled trophozoite antigen precursor [Giardia intestinalis]
MRPVIRLYLKTARAHLCLYICMIALPTVVAAAVALFFAFEDKLRSPSGGLPEDALPSLPLCRDLPGCTDRTVYLAFSPDTPDARRIVDRLVLQNGLEAERVVAVRDRATMQRLVAGRSLGPGFVDDVAAAGLGETIRGHLLGANSALAQTIAPRDVLADRALVAEMLGTAYGLDSEALDAFEEEWAASMGPADDVFLALDLDLSGGGASPVPQAVQYSLWYSQELMARFVAERPSPRTLASAANSYALSYAWSPASFSILGAVHNALAGALINRTVSYSLGEYPARTPTNTLAST